MATNLIGRDLALDVGTATTLVYARGEGVVLDEPSVVAVSRSEQEVVAVGAEAHGMVGRTPAGILALRPLQGGVIADLDATEQMLRQFIARVHGRRYFARPRLVVAVPSSTTPVELRALEEATYEAGARQVYLLEAPLAAAIGIGLPVHEATGHLVIDVGAGTTEVAVVSLGGIVTARTVRIAGDELDRNIVAWCKREHGLVLGAGTAEDLKTTLGSAFPCGRDDRAEVTGRDLVSGLPRSVVVSSTEVRVAMEDGLREIVEVVRATLDQTPPELVGDIMARGLVLTGGGALLAGLDDRLRRETGIPVYVAPSPRAVVVSGAGRCAEEFETLGHVLVGERRRPA